MTEKKTVRVRIVGEEYALRSDADPEHTREVAAYVDRVISGIRASGTVIETHKLAILAALQIADDLLRLQTEVADRESRIRELGDEIARWLPPAKRASDAAG